jgi:phosphoglucosamine mutase
LVNVRVDKDFRLDDQPAVHAAVARAEAELGLDGRIVLRPSGTEPLIRVMVEGRDQGQVARLAEDIAQAVRDGA